MSLSDPIGDMIARVKNTGKKFGIKKVFLKFKKICSIIGL